MKITLRKVFFKLNDLIFSHYSLSSVARVKTYCLRKGGAQYKVLNAQQKTVSAPVKYINEPQREPVRCILPEQYIAIIPNARVIGRSNAILTEDLCFLYDLLCDETKYRVSDCAIFRKYPFGETKYILSYKKTNDKIEAGIYLDCNYSNNYYHFLYESAIKFYLLNQYDIDESVPVLVGESVRLIPQLSEIVSILAKNRKVIYIKRKETCSVKTLYYPSFVNFIPPNFKNSNEIKTEDVIFDFKALNYLRDTILKKVDLEKAKFRPKKIFISRKNALRRSYNENEIIDLVVKLGYTVVSPEMMTFIEQVEMFNNADDIIAATGAALSNLLFCHDNCSVLCLISERYELSIFSNLAFISNVDLEYLASIKTYSNDNIQHGFIVDINTLKDYLQAKEQVSENI